MNHRGSCIRNEAYTATATRPDLNTSLSLQLQRSVYGSLKYVKAHLITTTWSSRLASNFTNTGGFSSALRRFPNSEKSREVAHAVSKTHCPRRFFFVLFRCGYAGL